MSFFCQKLQKEAEPLTRAPVPGELGERILANISKEAWMQWMSHQTLLINEHRLNLLEPDSKAFLMEELEKYFFGSGSERPQGYVEQKDES